MIKELGPGFRLTLVFTILTGLLYPAVMTGISQLIFPRQANGSLVTVNGKVVGSSLHRAGLLQTGVLPSAAFVRGQRIRRGIICRLESRTDEREAPPRHDQNDDKNNEVVDFDGVSLRIVHYCLDNDIPYESSVPLDQFKDAQGNLDDVEADQGL